MINAFNRVITILALLSIIACAGLAALNTMLPPFLHPMRERAIASIAVLAGMPDALGLPQRFLLFLVALLVAGGAFLLLVLELRGEGLNDEVRAKGADGSETMIARSAILQRVDHAIERLDDVVQVDTSITGKGDGLSVHLDVTTSPYIDVPMKTEEIRAATKEVIEQQMGLVLKKVTVKIDHDKFREISSEGTM